MRTLLGGVLVAVLAGTTWAGAATATPAMTAGHGQPDDRDHRAAPADRFSRNEPSVAVSPLDPRRVTTAANTFGRGRYYIGVNVSGDGGHTFTEHVMPAAPGGYYQSDPHLAFDVRGRLYAAYLSFDIRDLTAGGLAVARSDDGGATWPVQPAVPSANGRVGGGCSFQDFPALAVDPRKGSSGVFVAWQRLRFSDSACTSFVSGTVMTARSRDGGRTWSTPTVVPTPPGTSTYLPAITAGPDGTVVITTVAYSRDRSLAGAVASCPSSAAALMSVAAVSRDGGRTFVPAIAQRFCAPGTVAFVQDPIFGAYGASSTGATYRLPASTNTVIDPVSRQLTNVAGTQDPVTGQQRALVATSRDGTRWAPAGAVPALPSENQQFPRLAVGPTGRLSLLYLAQLPGGLLVASHTVSPDKGTTWAPVQRLTSVPTRIVSPFGLGFIGDYLGNAVGPDGLGHPVWTDVRQPSAAPAADPHETVFYTGTIYTRAVRV